MLMHSPQQQRQWSAAWHRGIVLNASTNRTTAYHHKTNDAHHRLVPTTINNTLPIDADGTFYRN